MKVVQFMNDKYAFRKFSFLEMGYVYRDLVYSRGVLWWSRDDRYFRDCLADSIEDVHRKIREQNKNIKDIEIKRKDVGRVVK